jgi:S1-C subfamily serine protease
MAQAYLQIVGVPFLLLEWRLNTNINPFSRFFWWETAGSLVRNMFLNIQPQRLILFLFFLAAFCSGCVGFNKVVTHTRLITEGTDQVQQNPGDAGAHFKLGVIYDKLENHKEAITSYKNAIKIDPNFSAALVNLGYAYDDLGQKQNAIASFREILRINPDYIDAHIYLGNSFRESGRYQESITSFKEASRIQPMRVYVHYSLGDSYAKIGKYQDAINSYKTAVEISPIGAGKTLARIRELEHKLTPIRPRQEQRIGESAHQPQEEQTPQSGTGSGFFVSKMGHVITNAHVVNGCKKLTVGDNANKQVSAEIINTDRSNDLALLKLSSLDMASADSKSLIQKLSIVVVPLSSKGLLRSEDVRLGEKVLVAGYPFGDIFSNTIKVTSGIVSATRGAGDDSGQFQLDAAVQPGNSGGPIYDSSGNIVGVVVSQLDKRMVEKAIGSMPENVNFGIKASTVKQFLISSGLPSKKAEQTEEKSTEQLAEIAKNQALMVMCLQ